MKLVFSILFLLISFYTFPLAIIGGRLPHCLADDKILGLTSSIAKTICCTAVTTDPSFQCYPQIWSDKIIWLDSRLGNQDLFLYDLSQGIEKPLTQTPYPGGFPDIYENKVVYQLWHKGTYDIWLIDLSTGKAQPISEGKDWHEMLAKIWGDLVVWEDWRSSYGEGQIFLHNLKTGQTQPLSRHPGAQGHPDIFEDKIVWHDKRNGNWDIYLYDLSKGEERPLTDDPSDQFSPVIHENWVAWVDTRNGNWDIYLYDLTTSTTRCLCQEPSNSGGLRYGAIPYSGWMNGQARALFISITLKQTRKNHCVSPHLPRRDSPACIGIKSSGWT